MERCKAAQLQVLVSYDLEPGNSSESAEEILKSLRAALPRIRNKAVLRMFEARIIQARRPAGDKNRSRPN